MTQEAIAFMSFAAGFAVYGTLAWRHAFVVRREVRQLLSETKAALETSKANVEESGRRLARAESLRLESEKLHGDLTKLLTPAGAAGTSDTR